MGISKALYQVVRQRAQFRCEYCHYPELLSSAPLSIDHIQPQSFDGSDDLGNLALACRRCNERRYNFTTGIDPQTETPQFINQINTNALHLWYDQLDAKIITAARSATASDGDRNVEGQLSRHLEEMLLMGANCRETR